MYINAGKPGPGYEKYGKEAKVQLNDKLITNVQEVQSFVQEFRANTPQSEVGKIVCALKVDVNTNMGLIGDVKEQLREVNQLRINYSTRSGDATKNIK